jgi:hypothetical protein
LKAIVAGSDDDEDAFCNSECDSVVDCYVEEVGGSAAEGERDYVCSACAVSVGVGAESDSVGDILRTANSHRVECLDCDEVGIGGDSPNRSAGEY